MPNPKSLKHPTPRRFNFDKEFEYLRGFETMLNEADKSPKTITDYCLSAQQFARWLGETRRESYKTIQEFSRAITPTAVRAWFDAMLTERRAPGTINHRVSALRVLTRWARRAGWIESDPLNGITGVKQVQTIPRWLTPKEQTALRRATAQDGDVRNQAIVLLLLNAGLSVSEVAKLKLDDVTVGQRQGEAVVRGKGGRMRTVPLNAEVRQALRAYLKQRPKVDHDYFFVGQRRETLGKLGIEYQIATLARQAGLAGVTPNVLRHTFAKNLVNAGVPLDRVALLLGHRSLAATMRYAQASRENLARDVEKLSESYESAGTPR